MGTRRAARVFAPGEFLREELEARGWSQTDFAEILGRPLRLVNEIIMGKRGISPETAAGLAAALGTSPDVWLRLDASYQLSLVEGANHDSVSRRARLYEIAPIKEMVRRGWLTRTEDVAVIERQVLRFFELAHLDETPQFAAAARKSTAHDSPTQKAWLYRARHLARGVQAAPYSAAKAQEALGRLQSLLHEPLESRHVPRILADAGIRFVVVEPLPGSKIDGACFWLDDAPVIALSLRFDRIDNFWFVLMHEMKHVINRDKLSVDNDLLDPKDEERPAFEADADRFASEQLVPTAKLDSFVARVRPLYSTLKIVGFARLNHVHPGIVVGQLHYRKEVLWSNFRALLAPIRAVVIGAALTDGWGTVLPAAL